MQELFLSFVYRFHRYLKPQLTERNEIYLGEAVGAVQLTATELWHRVECFLGSRIRGCADGKCDQRFIRVQTRIAAAKIHRLELLDRLERGRGDERKLMVDAGQLL